MEDKSRRPRSTLWAVMKTSRKSPEGILPAVTAGRTPSASTGANCSPSFGNRSRDLQVAQVKTCRMSPGLPLRRTSSRHSNRSGGNREFQESYWSCRPWARCKCLRSPKQGRRTPRMRTFRRSKTGARPLCSGRSFGGRYTPRSRGRRRSCTQLTCKVRPLRSQLAVSFGPPPAAYGRQPESGADTDLAQRGRRLRGSGTHQVHGMSLIRSRGQCGRAGCRVSVPIRIGNPPEQRTARARVP
jgi:hypothetical protein